MYPQDQVDLKTMRRHLWTREKCKEIQSISAYGTRKKRLEVCLIDSGCCVNKDCRFVKYSNLVVNTDDVE